MAEIPSWVQQLLDGTAAPEREHGYMVKNQNGQRQDLIAFSLRATWGKWSLGVLDVNVNTCCFGTDSGLASSGGLTV